MPKTSVTPTKDSTANLDFENKLWRTAERMFLTIEPRAKSYSKTKAIQFDEFAPLVEWWDKREESEVAWKVKVEDLKKGFDLDVKNPNSTVEERAMSVGDCLKEFRKSLERVGKVLAAVEKEYSR